jgi:glycosyltransferase involved in cell wall biosynthesis
MPPDAVQRTVNAPGVIHLVYDLIRGGSEGQCARVAMGLARRGWPHRVAAFHRRGFFLEEVEAACGAVHEVAIRHILRPRTVREIRRLARWLRQTGAGILHAWDADAAIFGQWAAQWAEVRLVTSRRDLGQIYPTHKLALMRRADRVAVRVVANAEAVRSHFIAQGLAASKIEVLPNLLDLEEFDAQARPAFSRGDLLPPGRRLVVVNRLDPEKSTAGLIEALPQVRRRVPEAVLVVAGAGRELARLQQLAAARGVADAVCFLGEVHEVPALLRQCEAGALVPSRNEGLSNTLLEYMAAGLPVLATDCGGNRELVRDGETGRLVPAAATSGELAEAWVSLLQAREAAAAMGRHGRAQVEARHAREAVLDAFAGFYQRVSAGGGCPHRVVAGPAPQPFA